jgi:hypothetical protein
MAEKINSSARKVGQGWRKLAALRKTVLENSRKINQQESKMAWKFHTPIFTVAYLIGDDQSVV